MSIKKIIQDYGAKEAAHSFVFPVKLTGKQQKSASDQLAEARKNLRSKMTESDRLIGRLMQVKFQLEDYIKSEQYDAAKTFGYFVKAYLDALDKKNTELADELSVHKTLISNIINNKREASENFIVRMEIHSNNNIPADYWFRLIQKEKMFHLMSNKKLRAEEKKYVSHKVKVKV